MLANLAIPVIVCVFAVLLFRWSYGKKYGSVFLTPPGPPGRLFIGNLFDIPTQNAWIRYREMSRIYKSPLIFLKVFGANIIIVDSLEVARDLFDKRSSIYNDRLDLTWSTLLSPYGHRLKEMRRLLHQEFGVETVKEYQTIQIVACREMLRQLALCPEGFMEHIRTSIGQILLRSTYGISGEEGDHLIRSNEQCVRAFSASSGKGANLVNAFPIPGTLPDCAAAHAFENINETAEHGYQVKVIRDTLGSVYGAGIDTGKTLTFYRFLGPLDRHAQTVSTLYTFILSMVLHPDFQKKAQQDIDRMIGQERLPNFSDRSSLPYVDAILNECLRLHPVFRLNIPHRLMQDDVYDGSFLPKGSIIIANNWSILHDESLYPQPFDFNPDRFIKDGRLDAEAIDPDIAAFGFGRRKCPGRYLAKDSLWLSIASILACFNISNAVDDDGTLIIPEQIYEEGIMR
ncbi:hypothetical protein QCA50_009782 [Cerrena zonata]|uniref:Cytochrome P450 n=1 Tax=Cerrena zonata TaxID=2478898 RepID=A0AAW0G4G2_9APHY